MLQEKKDWIDKSKGIGIILVVMGHAINGFYNNSYNSQLKRGYEFIYNFIGTFHMPLFFIISGYLYAYTTRLNDKRDYFSFVKKKLISLGIPYIIFNLIYSIIGVIIHDDKYNFSNLKYILIQPISHFWYVYILLLLFIIIPAIELIVHKNRKIQISLMIIIILTVTILYSFNIKIIYPLNQFFLYTPLFGFGIVLGRKKFIPREIKGKKVVYSILIYLFGVFVNNKLSNFRGIIFIIFLVLGTIASLLIFKFIDEFLTDKLTFLGKIGKASFEIYLIHSLFVSIIRNIFLKINVIDVGINILCETMLGVLIPYSLYCLSTNIVLLKLCFRPYSFYKSLINNKKDRLVV